MNFEVKHLVRWGIPGWTYIIIIISYLLIVDTRKISRILLEGDASLVGLTALLTGVGIVLGHFMHQISMFFGFVIWNKWESYFEEEFELDEIMLLEPEGAKLQKLYSYRLGQVHALRALTTSGVLSSITLIFLVRFYSYSMNAIFLLAGILLLTAFVFTNYQYFKKNLNYYTGKVRGR